jgi:hypothetical protein
MKNKASDTLLRPCSHGCILGKPKGMATNGGCKCLDFLSTADRLKVTRMMYYIRADTRNNAEVVEAAIDQIDMAIKTQQDRPDLQLKYLASAKALIKQLGG